MAILIIEDSTRYQKLECLPGKSHGLKFFSAKGSRRFELLKVTDMFLGDLSQPKASAGYQTFKKIGIQ